MTKLRSWMNRKSPEDAAVYFGGETLWKTMYEQDGVEVKIMAAGVSAGSGGYLKNTRSVVLRVRYAGRTIILTGDGTVSTENAVVRFIEKHGGKPADELKADVLKVGHHGSHRTSNSASWIKLVNPYFAFFSADRSGSLDERKATGHRLPQALTASLMLKHAPRLKGQTNKGHDYIVSFQKKDYKEYNKHPDIKDDELEMPMYDAKNEWQTWSDGSGLITTLVKMGVSDTDADEADKGAQWQVVIKDTGHLDVRST